MQYDIQQRQLKLSESRIAIMAHVLRSILPNLGVNQDQIRQIPRLMIEAIKEKEHGAWQNSHLDGAKAEALAEILAHDATVEIIDIEPQDA